MSMTLEEMQAAVCGKMSESFIYSGKAWFWICNGGYGRREVHWPTEGLQVCAGATEPLKDLFKVSIEHRPGNEQWSVCFWNFNPNSTVMVFRNSLQEAWLEALCRVWWPEKWKD